MVPARLVPVVAECPSAAEREESPASSFAPCAWSPRPQPSEPVVHVKRHCQPSRSPPFRNKPTQACEMKAIRPSHTHHRQYSPWGPLRQGNRMGKRGAGAGVRRSPGAAGRERQRATPQGAQADRRLKNERERSTHCSLMLKISFQLVFFAAGEPVPGWYLCRANP